MQFTNSNDLEIAPNSVVIETARQLAEVMIDSKQYTEFERSYLLFREDNEAQKIIREFQAKQNSLRGLIQLNAVSEEDQKELQRLQTSFSQRPAVIRYSKAQNELMRFSQEIGDHLSDAIGMDFSSACRSGGCCG